MKRPTFFISSTIYDFADLRSAIKCFLEQQGCIVLASEYNDFRKPLDVHSYQACLDAIQQADYFILLVGSRVGGWYDKEKRISITQQEYQEAYRLHLEGRIKIINFVRADIWNLRADRRELEIYLENLDIEAEEANSIKNHPTKKATNPEFIINFINEISRNRETKEALSGVRPFPSGNWLHVFNSFRDIADVLQPEIFDGAPIDEAIMRRLLLSELKEVLRKSLVKFKEGSVYSPTNSILNFYNEHEVDKSALDKGYLTVNTKRWDLLSTLAINLMALKLNPLILSQVLSSPVFLRFDNIHGVFEEEPVYHALNLLQQEIYLLNKNNTSENLAIIYEHTPRRRRHNETHIRVDAVKFLAFMHLLLRWSNVITLSKSIIQHLEGALFIMPKVFGKSPIPNFNKELEKETVTQEDVNIFINEQTG